MQCNGMQGLCAQLTREVHLPYIYMNSVVVFTFKHKLMVCITPTSYP